MKIENFKISPATNTLNPEIKIKVWLKAFRERELPVSFSGGLVDKNEVRIASLDYWEADNGSKYHITVGKSRPEKLIPFNFYFRLTQKALDHIEVLRDQDENKDVNLTLKLKVGCLNSRLRGPNIHVKDGNENLNYLYEKDSSNKSSDGLKLLAASSGGEVLEVEYRETGKQINIPSSDWAQDYCPALGVGRFAIVDLYIPDLKEAETELVKYLNDAIQTVQKMEKYIHAGEWSNVIEESRKFAEVLREKNNKLIEQWKELLSKSGYHEDSLEQFYNMLDNLFQFSSKFVHRIDHDDNLREQVKVEKEDAYFIYTTSIGLVNLLSRKIQELKKSQ